MLTRNYNLMQRMDGIPVSRLGITDMYEGRILVTLYLYDQIFDLISNGKDPSFLAKDVEDFYVLEVSSLSSKKYVHIEKDGTVSITQKPTFFIDAYLIETPMFAMQKDILKNEYQRSDYYPLYGMYSLRKISYFERPVHLKG